MALEETTRNVDLLFHTEERNVFVLALPNTPIEGAGVVRDNVRHTFNDIYAKSILECVSCGGIIIGVAEYTDDLGSHEETHPQRPGGRGSWLGENASASCAFPAPTC